MSTSDKIEAFYNKERPFKEELRILRSLALQTEACESFKWSSPVYTIGGKNVFGIMGFKHHFGLWFFNGVYLKDPLGVLEAAQKGTKAMRHWKFTAADQIDSKYVMVYLNEAIANQQKGLEHQPERKKPVKIPPVLKAALEEDGHLMESFSALAPYKQREFSEYIVSAKMEKTRQSRLKKSLLLIRNGRALNDKYR